MGPKMKLLPKKNICSMLNNVLKGKEEEGTIVESGLQAKDGTPAKLGS